VLVEQELSRWNETAGKLRLIRRLLKVE